MVTISTSTVPEAYATASATVESLTGPARLSIAAEDLEQIRVTVVIDVQAQRQDPRLRMPSVCKLIAMLSMDSGFFAELSLSLEAIPVLSQGRV